MLKTATFKYLSGIFILFFLCFTPNIFSQVEYRYLAGFGTALLDINDAGAAVTGGTTFDFSTNTSTPLDPEVISLAGINNNGELIGTMPLIINNETYSQPAYKKNGNWYPIGLFPGATNEAGFSIEDISDNGEYITGQMSPDCCDYQAFLYNTVTGVLEKIADPVNEYSAGYSVNNTGIIGGWYDPQPSGTLRVPAYMTTGSVVVSVPAALPVVSTVNAVNAVTNGNLMAGDRDGIPFIFDQTTDIFTTFDVPEGYETATFTAISENGVAVGYAQIFDFNGLTREAIIYHPSLGSQPVFLKDILAIHGIVIPTADGKLGTAIAISPDGNYICGWENGQFFFAAGWAVNFNDLLLSTCFMECPGNIEVVSLTGQVPVEYSLSINCDENPDASIVLVSGLASGAAFPIGTTEVVHHLLDADGVTVLNTCTFNVTVIDTYCDPTDPNIFVEPITLVNISDINNASAETATSNYEDFTDIVGVMHPGLSFSGTFKGFTGGDYTDYFRVFFDWNQDGYFDNETESYDMGSITNSTGIDNIETTGTLTVPADALLGTTTMRVTKNWDAYTNTACTLDSGFGQIEDYSIYVDFFQTTTETSTDNFYCYPNPVSNILTVSSDSEFESLYIYNAVGQEVYRTNVNRKTTQIDVSALPGGTYLVKSISGNSAKYFKINKV